MTAIAILHRAEIIEQVANGAFVSEIASKLGVHKSAIARELTADPEYQLAREIGAETRLESSRQAIAEIADEGVAPDGRIVGIPATVSNLARARAERLKADQWFAEREFPHRWGQKSELKMDATINVQLVRFVAEPQRPSIEHDAQRISSPSELA